MHFGTPIGRQQPHIEIECLLAAGNFDPLDQHALIAERRLGK